MKMAQAVGMSWRAHAIAAFILWLPLAALTIADGLRGLLLPGDYNTSVACGWVSANNFRHVGRANA